MTGYNMPDNVSASDPAAPFNKTGGPVHDESLIQAAIGELDELVSSLIYLDRRINPNSHFNVTVDIYGALQVLRRELLAMIGVSEEEE